MNNFITINTNVLEETIRCTICENPIKTERGCNGSCKYDEKLFEKILQAIKDNEEEKPFVELIEDIRSMICKVNDYYGYTDSMHMFKVLFDQKYHGWVKRKEGDEK